MHIICAYVQYPCIFNFSLFQIRFTCLIRFLSSVFLTNSLASADVLLNDKQTIK